MIEIFGEEGLEEIVVRIDGGLVRVPVIRRDGLPEARFEGRREAKKRGEVE